MMPLPNTTCAREGCSEPTPWDMACIVFDARGFCSPDCAQKQLDALDSVPESITLHDPQFAVDRSGHPYADPDDIDIIYQVTGWEDARMTIRECKSIHPYGFRFSGGMHNRTMTQTKQTEGRYRYSMMIEAMENGQRVRFNNSDNAEGFRSEKLKIVSSGDDGWFKLRNGWGEEYYIYRGGAGDPVLTGPGMAMVIETMEVVDHDQSDE